MAVHYRTQGFILEKQDRGEVDRVFTIYTKDYGKMVLLARAERKIGSKLRGGLELFYLSEIEFIQGKTQKTLTDAILMNNFPGLRKDLARLSLISRVAKLTDRLIKGQEADKNIWQLLMETFSYLERAKIEKLELYYYFFLWNLLAFLGYELELYNCLLCQKKVGPQKLFFSVKEGGLVCGLCQGKTKKTREVSENVVKVLRLFLKKDRATLQKLKGLSEEDLKSLRAVSRQYLLEVLRQIE